MLHDIITISVDCDYKSANNKNKLNKYNASKNVYWYKRAKFLCKLYVVEKGNFKNYATQLKFAHSGESIYFQKEWRAIPIFLIG